MVKSQPILRYILRGIPAIAVAVLLSACSTTTNTAKNVHSETHAVGNNDSSSLQASQDEFENMVRNLDVKSRIMDQYADWKGVRYRLGAAPKRYRLFQLCTAYLPWTVWFRASALNLWAAGNGQSGFTQQFAYGRFGPVPRGLHRTTCRYLHR